MELHRERIRRAEWGPFMERFSLAHRGWPVRVGIIDTCLMRSSTEAEARAVSEDALFEGGHFEVRSGGTSLSVVLGLRNVLTTHAVRSPRRVFVERSDGGAEEAVRIDSADGTTLLLQFGALAGAGQTDGIAPGEMAGNAGKG
jgi:hypothetical protein